jgi:dTDP-4-dehydrorhamnose 3,5-epimerase
LVEVRETALSGVLKILPKRFSDERGFFSETWNAAALRQAGIDVDFVQDNHSCSARGVLRGLHYQLPPFAQTKLVRVFDVAVDIRRSSPTFGRWIGVTLSADQGNQLLVPAGFAHGFLALEEGSELQYKVSAPYSGAHDRSIIADDPAIGIDWPIPRAEWRLSAKDEAAPAIAEAELFE